MISFIILHYKNIDDTIECIESIKKIKTKYKYSIIVVDNGSTDEKQLNRIKEHTKDLIVLKENTGFANGNNVGCKYAIEKYNPDFLCVINNDTVIQMSDFIDKIYELYDKYKFHMLGPKIITNGGDSVNPFPVYKDRDIVVNAIKKSKLLIFIYKNPILRFMLNLYINTKRLFKKPHHLQNGKNIEEGVALHGCAIIFSRSYYEKYDDVFFPNTFLYHEEEFIYQRVVNDKLKSLYHPQLKIFHKEGASLNKSFKQDYKKLIFRNTYIIDSLEKLLKEMDKN